MLKDLSQDELYLYIKNRIKTNMKIDDPNFFQKVINGEINGEIKVKDVSPLELTNEQKENILENLSELQSRWLYGMVKIVQAELGENAFNKDRINEEIDRICDTSFTRFGIEEHPRANKRYQGANVRYNIDEYGEPLEGLYRLNNSSEPQRSIDIICLTTGEGKTNEAIQFLASKDFLTNEDNIGLISILIHESCHSMQAMKKDDTYYALITKQHNSNIDTKRGNNERDRSQHNYVESGTEFITNLVANEGFGIKFVMKENHRTLTLNSKEKNEELEIFVPIQFTGYYTTNPYRVLFNIDRPNFINDYVNGAKDEGNYFFSQFAKEGEKEGKKGYWLSNNLGDLKIHYSQENRDYWTQGETTYSSGQLMVEYEKMANLLLDAYQIKFENTMIFQEDSSFDEILTKYLHDTMDMSSNFPKVMYKDGRHIREESITTLDRNGDEIEIPVRPMDSGIAKMDEKFFGKCVESILSEDLKEDREINVSFVLDMLRRDVRENKDKQFGFEDFLSAIEKTLEKEKEKEKTSMEL